MFINEVLLVNLFSANTQLCIILALIHFLQIYLFLLYHFSWRVNYRESWRVLEDLEN